MKQPLCPSCGFPVKKSDITAEGCWTCPECEYSTTINMRSPQKSSEAISEEITEEITEERPEKRFEEEMPLRRAARDKSSQFIDKFQEQDGTQEDDFTSEFDDDFTPNRPNRRSHETSKSGMSVGNLLLVIGVPLALLGMFCVAAAVFVGYLWSYAEDNLMTVTETEETRLASKTERSEQEKLDSQQRIEAIRKKIRKEVRKSEALNEKRAKEKQKTRETIDQMIARITGEKKHATSEIGSNLGHPKLGHPKKVQPAKKVAWKRHTIENSDISFEFPPKTKTTIRTNEPKLLMVDCKKSPVFESKKTIQKFLKQPPPTASKQPSPKASKGTPGSKKDSWTDEAAWKYLHRSVETRSKKIERDRYRQIKKRVLLPFPRTQITSHSTSGIDGCRCIIMRVKLPKLLMQMNPGDKAILEALDIFLVNPKNRIDDWSIDDRTAPMTSYHKTRSLLVDSPLNFNEISGKRFEYNFEFPKWSYSLRSQIFLRGDEAIILKVVQRDFKKPFDKYKVRYTARPEVARFFNSLEIAEQSRDVTFDINLRPRQASGQIKTPHQVVFGKTDFSCTMPVRPQRHAYTAMNMKRVLSTSKPVKACIMLEHFTSRDRPENGFLFRNESSTSTTLAAFAEVPIHCQSPQIDSKNFYNAYRNGMSSQYQAKYSTFIRNCVDLLSAWPSKEPRKNPFRKPPPSMKTFQSEKTIHLGSYEGREFVHHQEMTNTNRLITTRVFRVKDRLVIFEIVENRNFPDPQAKKAFFDSIKIVPEKASISDR